MFNFSLKKIEIIDDSSGIIVKYVKPNLKILGPKFGSKINELKNELEVLQKNQIDLLEKGEIISLNIFDEKINIAPSEVLIEFKDIEGWIVANNDKITVALDTRVNEKLFNISFKERLRGDVKNPVSYLDDLTIVRQWLTGAAVFALFDLPWVPLYVSIMFVMHLTVATPSSFARSASSIITLMSSKNTNFPALFLYDATNVLFAFDNNVYFGIGKS